MIQAAMQTQSKVAERKFNPRRKSLPLRRSRRDLQKVIHLQVLVTQSKSYESAASSADDRVQVMYSAVGSIVDLLSNDKSQLTSASRPAARTLRR